MEVNYFAKTNFRGAEKKFGIIQKDRRQHMYVIGKTGTGKTELLKNMAIQDIERKHGVAIIDPHGEFVEEVLDVIPSYRINDVIYFNPADTQNPIGFNILQVPDPEYKHLVASGLMGIFTKIWSNVWSARMEYILNNCILALLDTPNTTLLGINRLLVDKDYRQKIINNVSDSVVKSFWVNEYAGWREQFRNEAIAPIQNKVGQFLSASLIRNIVGQSKSTINIQEIMDNRKVLLVNVSKGLIGEDNSSLLGAMMITKIQLAAMERVRINPEDRKDFYLYVDEFQNFVTDSFANILSEARKYRLNLIFAHQYIGQLVTDGSTMVRDAVFGNVGTLVTFRVGAADAEFLEKEFEPKFLIEDIVRLENYNVYLRLMIDGFTSRPFSATTLPPRNMIDGETTNREKIINASRERYANPRDVVEDRINRWSNIGDENDASSGEKKNDSAQKPQSENEDAPFSDTCWACGEEAKLNFEPDGSRPVYCKNCLQKVRKGEDLPLSFKPAKKKEPKDQGANYKQELDILGIGVGNTPPKPKNEKMKKSFPKKPPMKPQAKPQAGKAYSQPQKKKDFSKNAQKKASKKEVDLNGLREAMKKAME